MGIYTAYEIEFLSKIEWDDDLVRQPFSKMNCFWLYLRDFPEERLVINLYSTTPLVDVLRFIIKTFKAPLKVRDYGTTEWSDFPLA
jgi:hypothetical protein